MTVSTRDLSRRWGYVYALLTGILGLLVLGRLFASQETAVDLPTLLLFTGVALIVSYFQIPIGKTGTELGLHGAILLGAVLAGGPILGGWAACITGLATPIKSINSILEWSAAKNAAVTAKRPPPASWVDNAATAVLNVGRNVIAITASWLAYQGMGGTPAPITVNTRLALALIILCVVYALVRTLWQWPMSALQSTATRHTLTSIIHPGTILIELAPLPVSLLISATFVQLGWSFFLLLALVFIGLGALMRQMIETICAMRKQIDTLVLTSRVRQIIASTPHEIEALISLAHELCTEIVTAAKLEIGLYTQERHVSATKSPIGLDGAFTHVNIQVATHAGKTLPPMHVPITPLWEWISELQEPLLIQDKAQIEQLPVALPPLSQGRDPQAAMFVPLLDTFPAPSSDENTPRKSPLPIGALVFQSPHPNAFSVSNLTQVTLIAEQVSTAISASLEKALSNSNEPSPRTSDPQG
jgi:hypothetical protein